VGSAIGGWPTFAVLAKVGTHAPAWGFSSLILAAEFDSRTQAEAVTPAPAVPTFTKNVKVGQPPTILLLRRKMAQETSGLIRRTENSDPGNGITRTIHLAAGGVSGRSAVGGKSSEAILIHGWGHPRASRFRHLKGSHRALKNSPFDQPTTEATIAIFFPHNGCDIYSGLGRCQVFRPMAKCSGPFVKTVIS